MKVTLIAAVIPTLLVCDPAAMAQVSGMASPTLSVGATSPLGLGAGSAVSQTGIPLGATEIASPGISPAPIVTGTASMQSGSTTCSTLGTSPSGMFGSTSSYDGGGMAVGSAAPATAATSGMSTSGMSATSGLSPTSGIVQTSPMSGMCGAGSSGVVSSSTPTSPTTPGGIARTGVPLGSVEINNLGVSSATAVPMVSVSPTAAPSPVLPVIPTVTSSPAVSSSMACPTPAHGATSNVC